MYQVPSVYAHILNGLLLFAGVVYLFVSRSRDSYQILVLILLFYINFSEFKRFLYKKLKKGMMY